MPAFLLGLSNNAAEQPICVSGAVRTQPLLLCVRHSPVVREIFLPACKNLNAISDCGTLEGIVGQDPG